MRLWSHLPKRIAKKAIGSQVRVAQLQWAMSLKLGDVINTCDLFNHVVKDIHPYRISSRRGSVICNIDIFTDRQTCCALSCWPTPALTQPQLLAQLKNYLFADDNGRLQRLIDIMESGTYILDDRLLLKPEFHKLVFP